MFEQSRFQRMTTTCTCTLLCQNWCGNKVSNITSLVCQRVQEVDPLHVTLQMFTQSCMNFYQKRTIGTFTPSCAQDTHHTIMCMGHTPHHHVHGIHTIPSCARDTHHTTMCTGHTPPHSCARDTHHTTMCTGHTPHHHVHGTHTTPPCARDTHHTIMCTVDQNCHLSIPSLHHHLQHSPLSHPPQIPTPHDN